MVLGICRRTLRDHHDAEDAFQATFLVLVRRARSLTQPELLANWLYGVALRTARRCRARNERRRAKEKDCAGLARVQPMETGISRADIHTVLDHELSRLPEVYRAAVVLCDLEGMSRAEAAGRLRVPEGTVSSRLARARVRLRNRLTRRGVVVPAGVLAALLTPDATAVAVPQSLLQRTSCAAIQIAAGSPAREAVSASVATLTEGVLKAMFLSKLKAVTITLAGLGLLAGGAHVLGQGPTQPQPDRLQALEAKIDRLIGAFERRPSGDAFIQEKRVSETRGFSPFGEGGKAAGVPADVETKKDAPRSEKSADGGGDFVRAARDGDRLRSLERRMQIVEQKLEAVMRRLEGADGEATKR
jgi:RNA polymerase sigma factor (sigma-70 family)